MTLQELGQSLKEQREAVGLSIDDIAGRIKISTRILRSIEEGSMVGMPHAVYTKRFIRSFGTVISYDQDELNAKLDIIFPPESLEEARIDYGLLTNIEPPAYGGLKKILGLLLILAVFAGLAAGGWFVAKNYGDDIWNLIKQPFSAVSIPAASNRTETPGTPADRRGDHGDANAPANPDDRQSNAPASRDNKHSVLLDEPDAQSRAEGRNASAYPAVPAASPASAGVSASVPASSSPAYTAVPASSPAPEQRPLPAAAIMQQILITASEECWLSSRADGAKGREYTLHPGESFVLTYTNNLELILGNAGGVSLVHNGKNLGRPGQPGQRVELLFSGGE